jgi:hypothetical protein
MTPAPSTHCHVCVKRLGIFWCLVGRAYIHPKCARALR